MRRTLRLLQRVGYLLAAVCGLAVWQLGCSDSGTAFTEGIRIDKIPVRDISVEVTETSATITWVSRAPTASEVEYGTGGLDRLATGVGGVTEHTVVIDGLSADTLYRFRIRGLGTRYVLRTLGGTRTRIAFVSDRESGRREIYFCLDHGENVTRVTTTGGHSPAFSPDGSRLAWVARGAGGLDDIFVAELDAAGIVEGSTANLTNTADRGEGRPAWSPDGTRLAFSASPANQRSQIILRTVADGTETVLVDNGAANDNPAWSPDGTRLAFCSTTRTALVQLRQRPVTAGSLSVVLDNAARTPVDPADYALISEADGLIDFSRGSLADEDVLISYTGAGTAVVDERRTVPRPQLELFTIAVDGTDLRRLTDTDDARGAPVWHPDGRIVHTRESSTVTSIVSVLAAGGSERTLVGDSRRNRDPALSPDGSTVVYSTDANEDGLINLYTIPLVGGDAEELMNFSSGDTQPAWAPIPVADGGA